MKIKLEYPYSDDWEYGKLWINNDNRQTLTLIGKTNSMTSYARYLMAVKVGRYLTEEEEVDHINTDHTDDSIDNLQILSVEEHKEKTIKEQSGETYNTFVCSCCGNSFVRSLQRTHQYTKYCSRECNYKMNTPPINTKSSEPSIDYTEVERLLGMGLSDVEVGTMMNINRNSVLNYRQKNNIPSPKFHKVRILEDNIDVIRSLLENKTPKVDIMKQFDVAPTTFKRFIKKHNL